MAQDELFEIFDENDNPLGFTAPRSECHGNPALIHRTAHVVVFSSDNRILLQKRSMVKDIQPGKWDTAVGGHLDPGETYEEAAVREMEEELGVKPEKLEFLFNSKIRNEIESENIGVYKAVFDGPFDFDPSEIDEVRFWNVDELKEAVGGGELTPNLECEVNLLLEKGIIG